MKWAVSNSEDYLKNHILNHLNNKPRPFIIFDLIQDWNKKERIYTNFKFTEHRELKTSPNSSPLYTLMSPEILGYYKDSYIQKIIEKDSKKCFSIKIFLKPLKVNDENIYKSHSLIEIKILKSKNKEFNEHDINGNKFHNETLWNKYDYYWKYSTISIEKLLIMIHTRNSFFIVGNQSYILPSFKKHLRLQDVLNKKPSYLDICLDSIISFDDSQQNPGKDNHFFTSHEIPLKRIREKYDFNFEYIFRLLYHVISIEGVAEGWEYCTITDDLIRFEEERYSAYSPYIKKIKDTPLILKEKLLVLCIKHHNILEEYLVINNVSS